MDMILPAIAGVFLLVGLIAVFMSRETWRWHTITMTVLVMLAGVAFMYLAARTLKTHAEWGGERNKFAKVVDSQEKQRQEFLVGKNETAEGEPTLDRDQKPLENWGLEDWKRESQETMLGRGRVISLARLDKVDAASGTLSISVEQAEPLSLAKDAIVHVFEARSITEPQSPGRYLGPYQATAGAEKTLELSPLFSDVRPTPEPRGPLTIFEVAPRDSHEAFAELTDQQINMILGKVPQEVRDRYLRDGDDAKDTDPPQDVWWQVKFKKAHSVPNPEAPAAPDPAAAPVDPAAAEGADAAAADVATDGAAVVDPANAKEFKFQEGDVAVFDAKTAEALIAGGIADLQKKVYRRPLTDFPAAFRSLRLQIAEARATIAELERQNQTIIGAIELAKKDISTRMQEAERLTEDLAEFKREADAIEAFANTLKEHVETAQNRIVQLKQTITSSADELRRIQLRAAAEIDRRAPAPEAAASR
jgi:hypothetical protein